MTFRAFPPPVQPPPFVGRLHGSPVPACTLIMEITTPDGSDTVPALSGWALRTWPVARLGDVTLEAQARFPHLGGEDLREALDGQGWLCCLNRVGVG